MKTSWHKIIWHQKSKTSASATEKLFQYNNKPFKLFSTFLGRFCFRLCLCVFIFPIVHCIHKLFSPPSTWSGKKGKRIRRKNHTQQANENRGMKNGPILAQGEKQSLQTTTISNSKTIPQKNKNSSRKLKIFAFVFSGIVYCWLRAWTLQHSQQSSSPARLNHKHKWMIFHINMDLGFTCMDLVEKKVRKSFSSSWPDKREENIMKHVPPTHPRTIEQQRKREEKQQ